MVIEYSLKFFYAFNDISHLETLSIRKKNRFKMMKFVTYSFIENYKSKVISSALTHFLDSVKCR